MDTNLIAILISALTPALVATLAALALWIKNRALDTRVRTLARVIDGGRADARYLRTEIDRIQNSPGPITPEDQATLDGLEARAATLNARLAVLDERQLAALEAGKNAA